MKSNVKFFILPLVACWSLMSTAGGSQEKGLFTMRLDNGLTMLVTEQHELPVVSVQVWVGVGSVDEPVSVRGLSHFLEHLMFKGTTHFPGDEISRRVEKTGGVINAGTSKEFTQYYIDTPKDGFDEALHMLSDIVFNAALPPSDIDRERPVVIEEIRRAADNPFSGLQDQFSSALFPTTPYGHNIIGSDEVIRSITRDAINAYYHRYYVPGNMIVSVAGDVDAGRAADAIKKWFGGAPAVSVPTRPSRTEPPHTAIVTEQERQVEHVYWQGGFTGPDCTNRLVYAADVAATILGGGRSSRLNRTIREQEQLAYSISSSFWTQGGTGVFAINAVCDPRRRDAVPVAVMRELDRLTAEGPTETELARALEMIRSQWYFDQETAHDKAATAGYWHLMGYPAMPSTYIEHLSSVTARDVVDFMHTFYTPQGLSRVSLVPADAHTKK